MWKRLKLKRGTPVGAAPAPADPDTSTPEDTVKEPRTGMPLVAAAKNLYATLTGKTGTGKINPTGLQYDGGRRIYLTHTVVMIVIGVLALAGFAISITRPTTGAVRDLVTKELVAGGRDFPTGQAVMFAQQVVRVWGTYDSKNPDAHARDMSGFLSAGMDTTGGWNQQGKQTVTYVAVNTAPRVISANYAIVDAAFQDATNKWRCVGVPVYAYKPEGFSSVSNYAMALAGYPSPVPCSPRTGAPNQNTTNDPAKIASMSADTSTGGELAKNFFPGFFADWVASDTAGLASKAAAGVQLVGLNGAYESIPTPLIGQDTTLYVDKGDTPILDGKTYTAIVPVTFYATDGRASITSSYIVRMRRDQNKWSVVEEPTPVPQSADAQGGVPQNIPAPGDEATPGSYATPGGASPKAGGQATVNTNP